VQANTVTLNFDNAMVTVEAENYDKGTFREPLPATFDESFRIAFNIKFLLAALKAIEQDSVIMRANQPENQVIFNGENEENLSYLVMPIKVAQVSRPPEPVPVSGEDYEDEEEPEDDE
jgi:DNA polymerase III sliding clamp (beta) subunit (PCNA family)